MSVKLKAAACSNKGRIRQNNEDNFCLNGHIMQREEMDRGGLFKCSVPPNTIFAVCDGMGGEEAGERASLLSVQMCAQALEKGTHLEDEEQMRRFLREGCEAVFEQAQRSGNHSGATLALAYAHQDRLCIANMGDSRIYRVTREGMEQVSVDHTEMRRLLSIGSITPAEISTHPHRHMILQYWGMPLEVADFQPHINAFPYVNGERYLLCSDGLTDMLSDLEIADILSGDRPVDSLCSDLVASALKHGGRDNVTVLVLEVVKSEGQPETARVSSAGEAERLSRLQRQRRRLAGLMALLCAGDAALATAWLMRLL